MNQEEFIDNNLEEKDVKAEKNEGTKKVLLILLVLLLFAVTYYYYGYARKTKPNQQVIVFNKTVPTVKQQIKEEMPVADQPVVKEQKDKTTDKIDLTKAIKPSDKASLAKLALSSAGKQDPFSGLGGKMSQDILANAKTGFLPPPPRPSYINGLPTIGELPKLDYNTNPYLLPEESVAIKGFVGDKVIVSVNGATESLKVNESFQGVRVLNIDQKSLIAKFKKDGEIITKSIKSLNDIEDRSDIKMIKNLNK